MFIKQIALKTKVRRLEKKIGLFQVISDFWPQKSILIKSDIKTGKHYKMTKLL